MSVVTGDFIGFSFNGHTSSELGITRISGSNRYDENLLPTFQDQTIQVPGGNGTYHFGTTYSQRQFTLQIAFDSLTEKQFRTLREVFQAETFGKLIFDERPYKYYMVKTTGAPSLKYICFSVGESDNEDERDRVYKGEGTLNFVAYYPFAKSVHRYLNEFNNSNIKGWRDSSRMRLSAPQNSTTGTTINVYNAGDLACDWYAYYAFPTNGQVNLQSLSMDNIGILNFSKIMKKGNDTCFRINSKTNLIEGGTYVDSYNNFTPSGNLYNECIISGDFFKIPKMELNTLLQMISSVKIDLLDYEYIYF